MQANITRVKFLESNEGEFTPQGEKEPIQFRNATFFQTGGGTCKLKLSRDIDMSLFQEMQSYDLVVDINAKANSVRVIDAAPSSK